jgi:poly(3-hydroxybutyrate) depolymerase
LLALAASQARAAASLKALYWHRERVIRARAALAHDQDAEHSGHYSVHAPQRDGTLPVVVYLHRDGGSALDAYLDDLDILADSLGFALVVPDAPDALGTVLDEIATRFDAKRIYVAGMTRDTYRIACAQASRLAALVVVGSASDDACTPTRPLALMHIHGTADPVVPYATGIAGILERAARCGAQASQVYRGGTATCVSYASCPAEVELCTVQGGGHTWPSGYQYAPVREVGRVSHDLAFTQIWEFLQRHTL